MLLETYFQNYQNTNTFGSRCCLRKVYRKQYTFAEIVQVEHDRPSVKSYIFINGGIDALIGFGSGGELGI